jgi:hypothetical protein
MHRQGFGWPVSFLKRRGVQLMNFIIISGNQGMLKKLFLGMASVTLLVALTSVARADAVSIINSNFNGTSIAAGSTLWVNSHMKVSGLSNNPDRP